MESKNQLIYKIFLDRVKVIYIFISSIALYIILNYLLDLTYVEISLIFRIYYIISSISLFILLKQIRQFYKQYISKIIWIYFILIIITSISAFFLNGVHEPIFKSYNLYIHFSNDISLLLEIFIAFALSEYYYKNKKNEILLYNLIFITFISIIIIFCLKKQEEFIGILFLMVELTLFIKISINVKNEFTLKKDRWNSMIIYIILTGPIFILNMYSLIIGNSYGVNILIDIIHLMIFRVIWNVILINLVIEPYKKLNNSLNREIEELDELNNEIVIKNFQMEKSINLLKKKEYLYSTFFRFMPHPILILNSDNDRILFANKQFLDICGTDKVRNIINQKVNKYIRIISDEFNNENYNGVLTFGEKTSYIQIRYLEKYSDSSKKLLLIKDKTTKVQTEHIKREFKNKKMEENIRTQFLSSISHDLKTPINVIYSANQVEKIYLENEDIKALEKYNAISKQNCIALIKLTNNLIDNSKISVDYLAPRLKMSNIVEIIEDNVMSLVDYVKWNNIELIFDTNIEECFLEIDQGFMDRIILNLISNAVKFTPDNGEIIVSIHEKGDIVTISVKDNGNGMEKEFIDKAFNRYAVGKNLKKRSKNGTGIGLFVVKELVELQGGTIRIKSKVGIGTNMIIEFNKKYKG